MSANAKNYKSADFKSFMSGLVRRTPHEPEFHQAVREVAAAVMPHIRKHDKWTRAIVLERMTEPERVFMFRIIWEDDSAMSASTAAIGCNLTTPSAPTRAGCAFIPRSI